MGGIGCGTGGTGSGNWLREENSASVFTFPVGRTWETSSSLVPVLLGL